MNNRQKKIWLFSLLMIGAAAFNSAAPAQAQNTAAAATQVGPVQPLKAVLTAPKDETVARVKAKVARVEEKNKFVIDDAGTTLEVKGPPDWYQTLTLTQGQIYTFDLLIKVKNKEGTNKVKAEILKITRADGSSLTIRTAATKPWDAMKEKSDRKPGPRLEWKK